MRKGLKPLFEKIVHPALPPSLKLRGTGKGGVNDPFLSGFSPLFKNGETPGIEACTEKNHE